MRRVLVLAMLVATTVVVQVALMPQLRLFGVVPDLGLVLAIAVAYHDGAETAAIVGFLTGVGFDLFLRTPVGTSALAYAVTGYLAGLLQTGLIRANRWMPLLLGALGGLVGGLLFVAVAILAGTDALISSGTLATVAKAALFDAVLSPFVFPIVEHTLPERSPAASPWRS